MAKSDLVASINQSLAMRSGEFVTVGAVVQVTQLAMTSPFVGDFQITDAGRLIVGTNVNEGSRVIVTPAGWFGYDANSVQTLAFYAADTSSFGAGDALLGRVSGNYMHFDASAGTLGVYSPAGAGFIAGADGSLYAGDTDGAHMHWSSADHAFQVRNGTDVKISLDANGDGFFDGTVYAQGGRIYGTMAVDGLLRVGDVDGPQVAMGKFSRINDAGVLVETGEIMATDANNLPWFHVVAGGETAGAGYFNLGATGDYAGRMSFDGETLSVAEWIVDSDRLRSPGGILNLSTTGGVQFIGIETTALLADTGRMLTFWAAEDDAWPTHRISAYLSDEAVDNHRLVIQAQPLSDYRGSVYLSALSRKQAHVRVRAVGGYDTASQQSTEIDLWGYREEGGGTFTHRRIDLNTDITRLYAYTEATIPGGTIQNGSILHSDGTYEPGAGAGVYVYYGGYWVPVALAGDATGWEALDVSDDGATAGNVGFYTCSASGGSFTINLPAATAKPRNWEYTFYKSDTSANTITIDADGAATINGATTYVLRDQHQAVTIRRVGANWNVASIDANKYLPLTAGSASALTGPLYMEPGSDDSANLFRVPTTSTNNGDILFNVARATFDTVEDVVWNLGFNNAIGGGKLDTGLHAWYMQMENDYRYSGDNYVEYHLHLSPTSGSDFRPMAFQYNTAGTSGLVSFRATDWGVYGLAGVINPLRVRATSDPWVQINGKAEYVLPAATESAFRLADSVTVFMDINTDTDAVAMRTSLLTVEGASGGGAIFQVSQAEASGRVNGRTILTNASASAEALLIFGATSQSAAMIDVRDASNNVLWSVLSNGAMTPATVADSSASNNTLYYSSTGSALAYKDSTGTVNLIAPVRYERHVQIDAIATGAVANQPTPADFFTAGGLQYPSSGAKYAFCQWEVPDDWDGTDVYFEIDWFPDSGAISGTSAVRWTVEYRTIAEGELINSGTSVTVDNGAGGDTTDYAQYETKHTRFTLAYNNANQPLTKQDHVYFKISRDTGVTNNFSGSVTVTAYEVIYYSTGHPTSN